MAQEKGFIVKIDLKANCKKKNKIEKSEANQKIFCDEQSQSKL